MHASSSTVRGSAYTREAFLFDGTGSSKALAPTFDYFDPDHNADRLLFTRPENSTIYWQVEFIERVGGDRLDYELVFYGSETPADDNVLAIFKIQIFKTNSGEITENTSSSAVKNVTNTLFLDANRPTLVNIPSEQKYYSNGQNGNPLSLNDEMTGTLFVTDHFSGIPYDQRQNTVDSYNRQNPASTKANDIPVIHNFEDERDKIVLDQSVISNTNKVWWKQETGSHDITLYNTANPTAGDKSHIIARIDDFHGTFNHDDFIFSDETSVDSDLISQIDVM